MALDKYNKNSPSSIFPKVAMSHRIILLNNLLNVLVLLSYLVIAFFLTPFIIRTIGIKLYGIWTIILSVIAYLTFIDLGMQQAVVKYSAEYFGKEDREGMLRVLAAAIMFYSIASLLGGILLAVIVWVVLPLLNIRPENFKMAQMLFLVMGIDVIAAFIANIFKGMLVSMQLFYLTSSIAIFFSIVRAGAVYLLLSSGYQLFAMAVAVLIGDLLEYITYFALIKWRYSLFHISKSYFKMKELIKMLSFGFQSFIQLVMGRVYFNSAPILVGYFLSATWAAFYSIPDNIAVYTRVLLWSLTLSYFPLFSNLEAKNEIATMKSIYMRYTRYTCLYYLPLLVVILTHGEPFIRIWVGAEFAEKSRFVIIFLAASLVIPTLAPLSGRVLVGTARQVILILNMFASVAIYIVVGIPLVKSMGINGLALAFFISSFPSLYLIKNVASILNISLKDYVKEAIGSSCISAILMGLFLFIAKKIYYPTSYLTLVIELVIGILLYMFVGYWIGLTKNEKVLLSKIIKGFFRKSQPQT